MAVADVELQLGSDNYASYLKRGSVRITEQLENRASSMVLTVQSGVRADADALARPLAGMPVSFNDGSRQLFTGYITRVEPRLEVGVGQLILLDIECTDLTYIFINHYATELYQNMTLHDIVEDLITVFLGSFIIDITNVDTGPTIGAVQFNNIPLSACFRKLADLTGYEWYIDFLGQLFFKPKGYTSAPESFTDASANYYDLEVNVDATQVRNSIVIEGGTELSSSYYEQIFVADGQQRSFPLDYKPKDFDSVYVDDGGGYDIKTYGVDPLNNAVEVATPGTYDFMFNYQEKFIRNAADETTLAAGYKIRVRYYYEAPIVTKVDDAASIAYMQNIENGGDGVHDFVIKDDTIASLDEAIARALKEIEEYGMPTVDIRMRTRTGLLSAGTIFQPGQLATVQFDSWGITTPTQYIIQEVITRFSDDGTDMEYDYQIRVGGRRVTTTSLLEKLLAKEEPIDDTVEQRKVHSVRETVGAGETITRETDRADTATVGAGETIDKTITTVPYNWQSASSKPAVWNLFVWG